MSTATKSQEPNAVQRLFNDKAASWPAKYEDNGPLRHRLHAVGQLITQRLSRPAAILDLGCGTGNLAFHLSRQGYDVTACDIAEQMIEEGQRAFAGAPIRWLRLSANWQRLPLTSAAFEAVVATSVFEYLHDPDAVLGECNRVLKPGGWLIFTAPDVRNRRRKLEKFLRPLAVRLARSAAFKLIPAAQRYLIYLSVSRQRLTPGQWREMAERQGFSAALDTTADTTGGRAPECGKYMLLLQFQKQR
ncbi:MAG TPA: methyltransferase domain-containing protein [Blastocatellia bacterium]|nr:methyltransferase domain-containing protein [Blastocatellia bacterium]